jgi:hypothetical protein
LEKSNLFFDEKTHTYTFNGKKVPPVSTILKEAGFIANLERFTEEGRDRGKAVHKAIEVHCRGAHCFKSPALDPYINAFKNFEKDCDWVSELVEHKMACDQYAGTCDNIGMFQGNRAILDVKTGAISATTGLQLVAYEKLYRGEVENAVLKIVNIKRFALQLTDTGRYILTEFKERSDSYIWDSAVAIYHWRRNHGLIKGD